MEEKERYEYYLGTNAIKDNKTNQIYGYVVDLLNQQDKELSKLRASYQQVKEENQQLKQQLAESEKNFIIANNLRKNSNEVLLNYKTEKYGLDKTIQELRKTKLSLPEKEWYYKGFENCERQMSSHIADLTLEVKELKQQLHDLPKKIVEEIRKWGQKHYNWVGDGTGYDGQDYNECIGFNMAIDQLNEILDTILKKYGGEDESK